jgi:ribonuclease HI
MRGWKTASGDPVKNIGLWKRVYRLLRQLQVNDRQVLFVKVKGHSGNPLNEYADKIAKAAKAEAAK